MLSEMFTNEGFKVTTAIDGVDGTFKYNNEQFDAIITDIKMPKKDGIKFVQSIQYTESQKRLRAGASQKPLPIILISASADDYRMELELLSTIDIIAKPFNPHLAIQKVKNLISKASVTPHPGSVLHHAAGDVIMSEGEVGSDVYYLKTGKLEVTKRDDKGKSIFICHIGPGEIVGEMGFLITKKRTATVTAIDESSLISIPQEKFEAIINAQPKWFQIYFQTIANRLCETTNLLVKERSKI